MSFGISAAAWAAIATVGATAYSVEEQKKAARKANKQAKQDATKTALQNRRSEAFAETEGSGVGQLGQISLAIEDDEDEDIENVLSI